MIVRMQMSCHRLLQRGFAKLYGYSLTTDTSHEPHLATSEAMTEYVDAVVFAENAFDLHYKMKGARV